MFNSNTDRKMLIADNIAFNTCSFVVRVEWAGRQHELVADDIDHALDLQSDWIARGANYVEIFRVRQDDGSLQPTIGAYFE
jgi:hypothetical protein